MESDEPAAVASPFLQVFSAADFDGMRAMLAGDVRAYITNATGGIDEVEGRDDYLRRLEEMDLPAAQFTVELTQAPVLVDPDRVLVMVEVRARKGDRVLHNFAAHLLRVAEGRITEWWMVDAKPALSDHFWS